MNMEKDYKDEVYPKKMNFNGKEYVVNDITEELQLIKMMKRKNGEIKSN